jgi:hypothetical protein
VSTINENVALTKPVIEWEITVNKRPELQLFDLQSEQIEISKTQFQKKFTQSQCFCAGRLWKPRTKHARQFIPNFYMLGKGALECV